MFEIRRAVLGVVGVVPESDRLRWEGRGANEFRFLADYRLAGVAPGLHVHAQPATLNLAGVDRQNRVAEDETGDDVGAAADRRELQIGLDPVVDPVELLGRQR